MAGHPSGRGAGALDFCGPIKRKGEVGSCDSLIRTMRLTAAALSGIAPAAQTSANPSAAMSALQEAAKDANRHRTIGELMGMTD